MITLDSFRKPWLRRRIAEVRAESREIWAQQLTRTLADMGIEPDSEVGKFVLGQYAPVWSGQDELTAALSEENIFDWLTIFTGEGT